MNRIGREPLVGGRNVPAAASRLLQRRDRVLAGGRGAAEGEEDESLDLELFSKTRGSSGGGGSSLVGSDGRDEPGKAIGVARIGRSRIDDLLDADMGKHDYDWLLTPPGTPHFSPSDVGESPLPTSIPNRSSSVRSVSNTRTSRLSTSQTENGQSVRPVRSSSLTRGASVSSHVANNNRTPVLNTSSASVTSRSVTPGRRPATPAKLSTPSTRPLTTRSSTPIKSRPVTSSPGLKTTTPQNSRPATPTKRPTVSTSSNSFVSSTARPSPRPSTPTRQPITRAATPTAIGRSPSVGRLSTSTIRAPQSAPSSRPSSPSPRPRAPVTPTDLPGFPNNAPPNLRTKLPERPVSAGRSRPGMTLTTRSNSSTEVTPPSSLNRRISLPIVARSKFPENPPKAPHSNGIRSQPPDNKKPSLSDAGIRRLSKTASTTDSTGFGRTISKKSMDMALRHMDIRQSMGAIRGTSLFPQSIRTAPPELRSARMSDPVVPITYDYDFSMNGDCNGTISGESSGSLFSAIHPIRRLAERENMLTDPNNDIDPCGIYRYDMLLKEDLKDTNWLHTVDDKSDQSSLFDHRFEPLPEPFDPL